MTYQVHDTQIRAILGDSLHDRARRSAQTLCDDLAALAASLERYTADVQEALTDLAARTAPGGRPSTLAQAIAGRFVDEVVAGPAARIATVVRGIRLCGVVLCAVESRDMGRCRCLSALARSVLDPVADEEVQRLLEHGFEPFLEGTAAAVSD